MFSLSTEIIEVKVHCNPCFQVTPAMSFAQVNDLLVNGTKNSPFQEMLSSRQKLVRGSSPRYKGTGHNKFVQIGPTLFGLGGVIEDTTYTYLVNISNKILLALKFELTQKY